MVNESLFSEQCLRHKHTGPFYPYNIFSSGEFHTFRLPVPSLWLDILQKVKAAGLNAISVYTHMGLINPSPGVVDFGGFRALQPLYDAAKAAGIFVVLRPGMICYSHVNDYLTICQAPLVSSVQISGLILTFYP